MLWLRKFLNRRHQSHLARRRRRWQRAVLECLEPRRFLDADAWHNVLQPLNVSGDTTQIVSPIDALLVINEINTRQNSDSSTALLGSSTNTTNSYLDVTCDAHVTPLDALLVINAINSGDASPPWQSSALSHNSDPAAGRIVSASCSPKIIEGSSLTTELTKRLVLPNSSSAIQVIIEQPQFDSTSQNRLRDAFEISLKDSSGQLLAIPFRNQTSAAFNWSESLSPLLSPNVEVHTTNAGSRTVVTFNLNGVAANTTVVATLRLVNNDGDSNSSVIVRSVDVIDSNQPTESGRVPSTLDISQAPSSGNALQSLESLTDVTSSLQPIYATTTIGDDGRVIGDLALLNASNEAISGPIFVAIDKLSSADVDVVGADGLLPDGRPYFVLSAATAGDWLTSGAKTQPKRLQFDNPSRTTFTYALTAYAQYNLAPTAFDDVPAQAIEAGRTYRTLITTTDPEHQSLTYSLPIRPEGMTIDAQTGQIVWSTTAQDVGIHSIAVRATDPYGLSVEKSFVVQVAATVSNRPPVFTSLPDTDATVAGSFEVMTYPAGAGSAAATTVVVGNQHKIVTANADTSDLSLIDGSNLNSLSLGQPPLSENIFQTGINVDVGLPPFEHHSERQRLDWLAQADFNGDGNIDIATLNYTSGSMNGPQVRDRWISVSLGHGDGTFAAPSRLSIRTTVNDEDDEGRPIASLLARDFDSDGNIDLLATTWSTRGAPRHELMFWKGLGNGQFTQLQTQETGLPLQRLNPADVNGDGRLDLIVLVSSQDRIGVMQGNGDGTFGPYSEFLNTPGANYSIEPSIADLDGRNGIDIAVVSTNQRRLLTLLNNGSGSFTVSANLDVPNWDPLGVYAANFDNDSFVDLVVLMRQGTEGGGMLLYRGTSDPALFSAPIDAGKSQPTSPINFATNAQPIDLNQDGYLDLYFGHFEGRNGITVALNRGDGTFTLDVYLDSSARAKASFTDSLQFFVIASDINRDGLIDLTVTKSSGSSNQVLGSVSVLLASEPGKFAAPRRQKYDTTGGIAPFTGINYAADFNNDGNTDLLGVVFQNGLRISFGNGDGTFQNSVPAASAVGNEFYASGFHADFNRDGFEDALWLGTGGVQGGPGARVLVGFNDGNGAFSIVVYNNPSGDYGYISSIVAGDFDDDGFTDFAGRGDGFVDVWMYAGNNSFTRSARLPVPAGDYSGVLSANDFNGDGLADIVTASGRTSDRSYSLLTTYIGRGDGTFTQQPSQSIFQTNSDVYLTRWSDSGDVNNDGRMDLVVSSSYSRSAIFLGKGDGQFETPTEFVSGSSFASNRNIYLRDLNGDNQLDLISIDDSQGHGIVRVRTGAGDGTFSNEQSYILSGNVPFLDFADLNSDQVVDIVAGTLSGGWDTSAVILGRTASVNTVLSADISGDARDDLISLSSQLNRVNVLLQDAAGFQRQSDILVGSRPVALAVADTSQDGRAEIVTANDLGRSLTILTTTGLDNSGKLQVTRADVPVGERLIDVAIANLDVNARPELVAISADARALFVLSAATGNYTVTHVTALGDEPRHLALADVTGDDHVDAVLTLPQSKRLMILPGDGQGHWQTPRFIVLSSAPSAVQLADFNQDGFIDLLTTLPDEDRVAMILARSDGRFNSPAKIKVGEQPGSLHVTDWNNDGLPDFVVNNQGDNSTSLVINRFDPTLVYDPTATATDPDGDSIAFSLVQAPEGMLIDAASGRIVWAPMLDQVGSHTVTLRANDSRGAYAEQSYQVLVTEPVTNHSPEIFSQPVSSISADNSFTYKVSSQDADGDRLRYRLIDGPEGAELNATTGELTWDPRLDAFLVNKWRFYQSTVTVPYSSTLMAASVTVEGMFSLNRTDINQVFFRKFSYMPYPFGIDTIELRYLADGVLRAAISDTGNDYQYVAWKPEVNRWYHLALTFDDDTRTMRVLVDGAVLLEKQLTHGLRYDGVDLQIGYGYSDSLVGSVANFRMWNVARTPEQLRNDWSRVLPADAPGLILDYRFDSQDAQTIRDYSRMGNHGRRISFSGPLPGIVDGLAVEQSQDFTIEVDDGRGGTVTQTFTLNVVPAIPGAISGRIFEDSNSDGLLNNSEPGLSGWQLYLDINGNEFLDNNEPRTSSSNDGQFKFDRVPAGAYSLRAIAKAGFTAPVARTVSVLSGLETHDTLPVQRLNGNEANSITGQLSWTDAQQHSLPVQNGWVVYIDRNQNGLRDEDELFTIADDEGKFTFANLSAGQYAIAIDNPPGWNTTLPASESFLATIPGTNTNVNFAIAGTAEAVNRPQWLTTKSATAIARQSSRWELHATDPHDRPLNYRLIDPPSGMAIDPDTGTVIWSPALSQIGNHRILVSATNDQGSLSIHQWHMNVLAPDSSPLITSSAPAKAYVQRTLRYQVVAQDAEDTSLTYQLLIGPASATLDPQTGWLQWTPTAAQVGSHPFTISVRDSNDNRSLQSFTINVLSTGANSPPVTDTQLRTSIPVGEEYRVAIVAEDQEDDAVTYTLVSGPAGASLSGDGVLIWTPATSQVGSHTFTIEMTDGSGGRTLLVATIDVVSQLKNSAPRVTSQAERIAVIDQIFAYDLAANDADGDALYYQLVDGPLGMSLDSARGTLRWIPTTDQLGPQSVHVRALDAYGAYAEQAFTLTVRRLSGPPLITSVPLTEASVGQTFLMSVEATDFEHDPLEYRLLVKPSGMQINAQTGQVTWNPGTADVGSHQIVLEVSDPLGNRASQAFAIQVSTGASNASPCITTAPIQSAVVGTLVSWQVTASDPDGDTLSYSFKRAPAGMTIHPQTGVIEWTPAGSQVGRSVVTIVASDTKGGAAVQSFEIDTIASNTAPQITSLPITQAVARGVYRYDVVAVDADRDPLQFQILSGPSGLTLDSLGHVRWQTSIADLGAHLVKIKVSDPRGGVQEQSFGINVVPDTNGPRVSVVPAATIVRANSREVFDQLGIPPVFPTTFVRVSASDNVGVTALSVTANGKPVALDARGLAYFDFRDWGFGAITIVAQADDAAGNRTTTTKVFAFVPFGDDPAITSLGTPVVAITSPLQGGTVRGLVEIQGSAKSTNFSGYKLSYRRADTTQYTTIASSTEPVDAGLLGTWDTSLLENDEYVLRLEQEDQIFGTTVFETSIGLAGEFKLGNFRVSFEDLSVPVATIPVSVVRTYDTLRSDRDSDFGFGWRLEYRNTDLRTSLPKSGLESLGIYMPFKVGTRVFVTLPGGLRQGFTFNPDVRVLPGFGSGNNLMLATPRFTPDPGTIGSLSAGGGSLFVNEAGELFGSGGIPWNPASPDFADYELTMPNGLRYSIDGAGLMRSITDANGFQVTFSDDAIKGPDGVGLTIKRDALGRIVSIADPTGAEVTYAYDTQGNLARTTDRDGRTTEYRYRTAPAHYLDQVIDPLGRTGVRLEYDADGRLTSGRNANGESRSVQYDLENGLVTQFDALGHPRTVGYDAQGNVVYSKDALGGESTATYDALGNSITETDALGNVVRYQRDADGRPLVTIDPNGNATYFAYDSLGNPLTITDALGNTNTMRYDARGNMLSSSDALGGGMQFDWNSHGQTTGFSLSLGGQFESDLNAAGFPIQTVDAHGLVSKLVYDGAGRQTSLKREISTPTGTVELVRGSTYSPGGQLLSQTTEGGQQTRFEYDAAGHMTAMIDALGNRTEFEYDAVGRMFRVRFADGSSNQIQYDAAGNKIATIDALGRITHYRYDNISRLIETIEPDATPDDLSDNPRTRTEYDAVGQVVAEIDRAGRRIEFAYDAVGNVVAIKDPIRGTTQFVYNAANQQIAVIDPLGRRTEFVLDAAGNAVSTVAPDGTRTSILRGKSGEALSSTDENGNTTHYTYTDSGSLESVTDGTGHTTQYTYDSRGLRTSIENAAGAVTRFEYDAQGNQVKRTLPGGEIFSNKFDIMGRLTETRDPNGNTLTYRYDSMSRLIQRLGSDGSQITYSYNLAGLPTSVIDARGTTTYQYDTSDRLVSSTEPDGTSIAYTYNVAGQVTSMTTPAGVTRSVYDSVGRLTETVDPAGQTTRYFYDTVSRLARTEYPNGIIEEYQYDLRDRVVEQVARLGASTESNIHYSYDPSGHIREKIVDGVSSTYQYDAAYKLLKEETRIGASVKTTTYSYDAVGNRVRRIDSQQGTTDYEYDINDRLLRELSGQTIVSYQWDANGNLLKRQDSTTSLTYSWTIDNLLASTTLQSGNSSQRTDYVYNANKDRVATKTNGQETRFLLDKSSGLAQVALEYTPAGTILAVTIRGGKLLTETRDGHVAYMLTDASGSVHAVVDSQGNVEQRLVYDAFGNQVAGAGAQTSYRFNGERRELMSGLDYLRARYYDPTLGRFISADPFPGVISNPMSLHKYQYADMDPVNKMDPTGNLSLSIGELGFVQTMLEEVGKAKEFLTKKAAYDEANAVAKGADAIYMALRSTIAFILDAAVLPEIAGVNGHGSFKNEKVAYPQFDIKSLLKDAFWQRSQIRNKVGEKNAVTNTGLTFRGLSTRKMGDGVDGLIRYPKTVTKIEFDIEYSSTGGYKFSSLGASLMEEYKFGSKFLEFTFKFGVGGALKPSSGEYKFGLKVGFDLTAFGFTFQFDLIPGIYPVLNFTNAKK